MKTKSQSDSTRTSRVVSVAVLAVALLLAVSPYLAGAQAGNVQLPVFADGMSQFLRVGAPVVFVALAGLFAPMLPKNMLRSLARRNSSLISFSAVRLSRDDAFWTADTIRGGRAKSARATADYPFSQPYVHRLTCWRGLLLNTGADPILDVTLTNQSSDVFLITSLGIEIIAAGCVPERRDGISVEPVLATQYSGHGVQTPDALTLFRLAHAQNGRRPSFALDVELISITELTEPVYLRPTKSFRFELCLQNFCASTPLHTLARIVAISDTAAIRSDVIYFRH